MDKIVKIFLVFICSFSLTGCWRLWDNWGFSNAEVCPPAFPSPIDNCPPPKTHGSIYQCGYEISLYEDHIPRHIGDILTVRLEEGTIGEKKAKMKTTKAASNTFPIPTVAGNLVNKLELLTKTDQQFNGEGETNEQNKLHGKVSVTVVNVLVNGNLVVQGESWITINMGREYVRLSGIVRPIDIDAFNVVSSQRLANARIEYSGVGQVNDAARGGLITRAMFKFWPY